MKRGASLFNIVSVALGLAFLYLPIAILVIYSFNASRIGTVWAGFSLHGYTELFQQSGLWRALRASGIIAASASTIRIAGNASSHPSRRRLPANDELNSPRSFLPTALMACNVFSV